MPDRKPNSARAVLCGLAVIAFSALIPLATSMLTGTTKVIVLVALVVSAVASAFAAGTYRGKGLR